MMSEISQTYDGRLWKWDRDGAYWYSEDGDELAPWDVFATMCTHDAHVVQLEAENAKLRDLLKAGVTVLENGLTLHQEWFDLSNALLTGEQDG